MTVADGVILLVLVISGLFAFVRGFTQEILSILAWVTAAFLAVYLYPFVAPWAQDTFSGGLLVGIGAGFVVFLALAAPLYFASHWIADRVRGTQDPGGIDRTFGFIFGLVRGLAIVAIVYWAYNFVVDGDTPDWMAEAKLRPMVESTENVLISLLPEHLEQSAKIESVAPKAKGAADEETGYSQRDRRALNQLVNTADDDDGRR